MNTAIASSNVDIVRTFNRAYTRHLGLLDDRLDGSPFSLPEARVLYEIAHRALPTAGELSRVLDMDRGQLSRILKRLADHALITTTPCPDHAKRLFLSLTQAGTESFADLNGKTERVVGAMLEEMLALDRGQFLQAARTISEVIDRLGMDHPAIETRGLEPGDLGWIIHRQGILYQQEFGWDWTYEALVAKILSGFAEDFDPTKEQAWIATAEGAVVGSIFLMRSEEPDIGKLRLLYVEKDARGLGVGRTLVDACVSRARDFGYGELQLWTNSVLGSARKIYEAVGFQKIAEAPHRSFGKDLIGQTWSLSL